MGGKVSVLHGPSYGAIRRVLCFHAIILVLNKIKGWDDGWETRRRLQSWRENCQDEVLGFADDSGPIAALALKVHSWNYALIDWKCVGHEISLGAI